MRLAVLSYGAILLFAATQTLLGLAPLTISVPLVMLGAAGTIGVSASFVRAWQTRRAPSAIPVLVDA